MVYLKCPKCPKRWDYKGKNNVYASCPDCKHPVNIKKNKLSGGKRV